MDHLLIFARHPELGRVKTRLARTIGDEAALAVYEELLTHTRAATDALPATHKTAWLAGNPGQFGSGGRGWAGYEVCPQAEGDLGHRMAAAFGAAFAAGATAVVVIGTDCPGLSTALLTEAFVRLRSHDLVLGPAEDGGYYLLGLTRLHPALFQNKEWSTASVRDATLADAARLKLRVALLPLLRDVDTEADLRAWRQKTRA